MITDNLVGMLKQLSTVGSTYLLNEGETEFDFKHRLRDFTDTEVLDVIRTKNPNTVAQLIYALECSTNDDDVRAHLVGFESEAELNKCLLEQLDTIEEELEVDNYPFDVLEGEIHD